MLTVAALALTGAAWYYVSLRRHPWRPCRWCDGSGKNAGSTRRRFGRCPKCGGTGRKDRLGVRLFLRR
jgi:DnaJ-class molecular chaperone